MNSLFLNYSISELVDKIKDHSLSHTELINETIDAFSIHEKKCLAWEVFDPDRLIQASEIAASIYKRRGHALELEGIPFGVKDIFNTREYPTQMGSVLWKGFTPGNNARVVDSICNSGGIVAGKTVTAEFAVHQLNQTLNPHNNSKTPGTSSSGSAAAVACGMVPFALGTQTAGSIMRPASFCGIWGFKPSFGTIPRTGILKTTDTLDTVGFLSANGMSIRPIYNQLRVKGPNYPFVFQNIDKKLAENKRKEHWEVALIKTHTWDSAKDYAKLSLQNFVNQLDSKHDINVTEINWPSSLSETHFIHEIIYSKSLSYYFQNEINQGATEISPIMYEMIERGKEISLDTFKHALSQQQRIIAEVDQLLTPFDVGISLSTSSSAPERGSLELSDPSLIWTMAHIPAVSAPKFRCPENMPFGVQFISRKWDDYILLDFIEELIRIKILPEGSEQIK
ncbi:MAG: amidase [Bacteroidetes bacterium]|nr:amidase [Bacteroidota bacterium]